MTSSRRQPRPTFLWQGVLILLPVAVLLVVGLISIRQDEQAAENAARQRAAENVQSLARVMRASVNEELRRYLTLQNMWVLGLHSESQPSVTTQGFPDKELSADIAKWERDYPRFKLAELALPEAWVLADGRQLNPPVFPVAPQPPNWFVELSPKQRGLWESLRAAQGEEKVRRCFEAFRDSHPSEEAYQAAARLQCSPENLAGTSDATPSETGISFEELACYHLLSAPGAQLTQSLLQSVWWRVFDHTSFASPLLLAQAGRLTNSASSAFQNKYDRMNRFFEKQNRVRSLLISLRQLPELSPWQTRFWSHWTADDSALALFTPTTFVGAGKGYSIWFVPEDVAMVIFARAAEENKSLIPPYASAHFWIEGVRLPPIRPASLPEEKYLLGGAALTAGSPGAPDSIRFEVKFYLNSREQMLAAERRRTKLFGALIFGAAFTAFIGLFAARRAFRRQLDLNEQKSNFVSSVSHELRAPIASVRLMAENLEGGRVSEPQKLQEYYHFIGQECRRLSALIENVLDFSRIEQGRKQYEFEPTDLAALTETTVKSLEPYAAEKGVMLKLETFNIQHSTPNAELNVDGRAIQQALVNLIDNAVKHSPKGATVTVGIEIRNPAGADAINYQLGTINLSVTDHGPGIPAAEHEKIFERFYRLGSELRRETQGIGIGLSLVKHIVAAHGGRVTVQSEPCKGSTFTIELPQKYERTSNI